MTLDEKLDLHPRVAYDLSRRGLLWVNEYEYYRYDIEKGGSIDFVACDPLTGQFYVIECKVAVETVPSLESQINRYYEAFCTSGTIKEVYAFFASDGQISKLKNKGIDVHLVDLSTPQSPLTTSWEIWEDMETVYAVHHGLFMLERQSFDQKNPHLINAKDWHIHAYYASRAQYYVSQQEKGDLSMYLVSPIVLPESAFYGDAE